MKDLIAGALDGKVKVYDTDASKHSLADLPYVVFIGGPGARDEEESMYGRDSTSGELTVRFVAQSRQALYTMAARVRKALDQHTMLLPIGHTSFVLAACDGPFVDTTVAIPDAGTYPFYLDDIYQIYTDRGSIGEEP